MNVNPLEESIGQTSGKPNSTRAEWINQLSELQEVRAYRPAREQARLCWRPLLERVTVKKGAESRVIASGLKGRLRILTIIHPGILMIIHPPPGLHVFKFVKRF